MTGPEIFYKKRIEELADERKKLLRKKTAIAWTRFLLLAATIIAAWQVWPSGAIAVLPVIIAGLSAFLFFVNRDTAASDAIKNLDHLLVINETEINVIAYHFTHLPDGKHLLPDNHSFAADLDLFGKSSLYQYMNRAETEQGQKYFAGQLLYPDININAVLSKQEAIKELKGHTIFRQQLQAHLTAEKITLSVEGKITKWLAEQNRFQHKPIWKIMRFLLPAISFSFLLLHITGVLGANIFYPLTAVMLIISMLISKLVMPAWTQLTKISPQLASLGNSALLIQQSNFQSAQLATLTGAFKTGKLPAPVAIKKLGRILDMLDIRLNPLVFLPLNTFLFWDLQQIFALEKWKKEQQGKTEKWFSSLAEIESLSSFANLSFNNPGWAYPSLSNEPGVFEAKSLGHPLISKEKSVLNDFTTAGTGLINIVTGSNMAGKSTFLRSAGCNLVLAMAGSPVCASHMLVSPMQVMSSMRIADNLEESTSTFYAELKKLKEVIDSSKERKPVFLLLDEILRGTNSADRHTGSKALIKQLVKNKATGIVATHDIELTKLVQDYPDGIRNYHFDAQVKGEELYFDYKLKPGICQSMNASILMKKIGIDL